MPDYVTVEDVEVMSAGMAWRGGSEYYVTAEHLADMVAAQADPLIRAPRIKLGHWSELFGSLAGMHDPTANLDSEPAFGSVTNLRLAEGGAKLIGDLIEVPDWLAEAMPSAYPTRSAEWVWDHATQGGHKYTAVLTDLALGGVWEPAVEDVSDITREQATAALAALLTSGPDAAAAALSINPKEPAMASKTPGTASVSQDRIVSAFEAWAWADDNDASMNTYWWWARDIRVDPDEIIASDGEGGTWRVPFTTDGDHDVTFGDPVEVRETYVDVAAATAAASAAQARHGQRVLASDLPRPTRPNPAASRPDKKENPMDDSVLKVLAAAHQLDPDTATEEQVNAAILAAAAATTDDDTETPEAKAAREAEEQRVAEEVAATVEAPKTVQVSQEVYEEQQRRLEALEAEREDRELAAATARRDGLANRWVSEGRITPAERALARQNLDINEDATTAAYEALATRRVPVITASGSTPSATATSADEALLAASRARMGHTTTEA